MHNHGKYFSQFNRLNILQKFCFICFGLKPITLKLSMSKMIFGLRHYTNGLMKHSGRSALKEMKPSLWRVWYRDKQSRGKYVHYGNSRRM